MGLSHAKEIMSTSLAIWARWTNVTDYRTVTSITIGKITYQRWRLKQQKIDNWQTFSFHLVWNMPTALSISISSSFSTASVHSSSDCRASSSGWLSLSNCSWFLALSITTAMILIQECIKVSRSSFLLVVMFCNSSISSALKQRCSANYKSTDSTNFSHTIKLYTTDPTSQITWLKKML